MCIANASEPTSFWCTIMCKLFRVAETEMRDGKKAQPTWAVQPATVTCVPKRMELQIIENLRCEATRSAERKSRGRWGRAAWQARRERRQLLRRITHNNNNNTDTRAPTWLQWARWRGSDGGGDGSMLSVCTLNMPVTSQRCSRHPQQASTRPQSMREATRLTLDLL